MGLEGLSFAIPAVFITAGTLVIGGLFVLYGWIYAGIYWKSAGHQKIPLVLSPCDVVSVVAELLACLLACELPVDGDLVVVHCRAPGVKFSKGCHKGRLNGITRG